MNRERNAEASSEEEARGRPAWACTWPDSKCLSKSPGCPAPAVRDGGWGLLPRELVSTRCVPGL